MHRRLSIVVAALVSAAFLATFVPNLAADGQCCFQCGGHEVCCEYTGPEPECGCMETKTWCKAWCGGESDEAECWNIE